MICDGRGTPLKVITTAANVNDVTQILTLVDGIPPVAGRPGRPRRRPDFLLGDKGYDSNPNRDELRHRRILPVISRKGSPNIKGIGKLRYVVEQTFARLHHFKRLAVRWERRTGLHDAFVSLACGLICWRRLKKARHDRVTSFWLQLTPLTQRASGPRLGEVLYQVPRPINVQDKVARERGETVHDRDFNLGTRGHGAVSYKQRHPLGVTHQMDDSVITPEGQDQHRELPVRRPNLDVTLTTRTQVVEAV
ncbi:transposase [Streptomyces poriferorum]|uniref:transposase n=1 Tax=Streptomyces poriferorum TaxID=2798799 RepID=UPI0035326BE7